MISFTAATAANGAATGPRLTTSRPSVVTLDGDPDQIEVSLDEGAAAPVDEVLERAAEFFVEHNDNYVVSWSDASHMISDARLARGKSIWDISTSNRSQHRSSCSASTKAGCFQYFSVMSFFLRV